jgi:hypothetical protein
VACDHKYLKVTAATTTHDGYVMKHECQKCGETVKLDKITYKKPNKGRN